MAASTCTISGGGQTVILTLEETGPVESSSPPPSSIGRTIRTGIVELEVPVRDGDLGQDMGPKSPEILIEGLSLVDVRDKLTTMAMMGQLEASGVGKFSVVHTSSTGVSILNQSNLAFTIFSWRFYPGTRKWFRYSITMKEFKAA
jgi:hypothetical protein